MSPMHLYKYFPLSLLGKGHAFYSEILEFSSAKDAWCHVSLNLPKGLWRKRFLSKLSMYSRYLTIIFHLNCEAL